MLRYCLEILSDGELIHNLDCPDYDLGTLLGLGCVVDLGEFPTAEVALERLKRSHPAAMRCPHCCKAELLYLARSTPLAAQQGSGLPSG